MQTVMTTNNATDPRDIAELSYDRIAHEMHRGATRKAEDSHQPHSHLYWQWNKTFTSWESTGHMAYTGGYVSWIGGGISQWPTLAELGVA